MARVTLRHLDDESADITLVVRTTGEMRDKLEKKRREGCGGWNSSSCSNAYLKRKLIDHVLKGDMIDVMNFAAMIYMREEEYGKGA